MKWGMIGPGIISRKFIEGVRKSGLGEVIAVASRSEARAREFVERFGGGRPYSSYEALLEDRDVDAVYIATPHPFHAEWAIRAAEAGKHVLCEKPIGMNLGEAEAIFESGSVNDVFIMEAFMYRCYPQTAELYRLIGEGKIGTVKFIEAAFSFHCPYHRESRLLANRLGGGGIMDVGCYPVSLSRLIAGAVEGKPFLDPVEVSGSACLGETGVDEVAAATLKFPNGVMAQCRTGIQIKSENKATITGSEGTLVINDPWFGRARMEVRSHESDAVERIEARDPGYHHEVIVFTSLAFARRGEPTSELPGIPDTWMSPEDSLGNIRTLDRWREAVELTYEFEKPGPGNLLPVHGRGVKKPGDGPIARKSFPGFSKPLSRVALGLDNQPDLPFLRTMVDDFVEKGGNVLDTAFVYGAGKSESLLGGYLASRPGLREDLVIITKGAHTPYCFPGVIHSQLDLSLERLGLDDVDIYLLHRDNPDIPVVEFVDALNEEIRRGRIKNFGVSNWTLDRIREFNAVAEDKGMEKIKVVSNQLSLAEMIEPVWKGCVSARGHAMAEWLEESQTLLLPWSSQARGFFTERSGPEKREDPDFVRSWYSEANFERKSRAEHLSEKYGVTPLNIALAWILARPYPVCPLVGPRRLAETRTLLPGLELKLTPEECAWLNLETG